MNGSKLNFSRETNYNKEGITSLLTRATILLLGLLRVKRPFSLTIYFKKKKKNAFRVI